MPKLDILTKTQNLFSSKKWVINDKFDSFCSILSCLTEEQQDLIIELTCRYSIVGIQEYMEKLANAIYFGLFEELENKKIYIFPLTRIKETKNKSGQMIYSLFKCHDFTWISKNFYFTPIEKLKEKFRNDDSIILLVDDYVGSGNTAKEVCNDFLEIECNGDLISHKNIKIACIVAQKQGIDFVKNELDIDIYADEIHKKGITDYYDSYPEKLSIMIQIGKQMKFSKDLLLGYENTEALITLLDRTPNNTFPIYWCKSKKLPTPPPFPRKLYNE